MSALTHLAWRDPQNEAMVRVTTGTERPWGRGLTVWTQTPLLLKTFWGSHKAVLL